MNASENLLDTAPLFRNLIGQDKAKAILQNALRNNRLGHGFLFRGPAGVGKKRAALTFAAYINCASPNDHDACGKCPSCVKFKSGNHPDLIIVEPDGVSIKINQVRALIQSLSFPPFEARYRVVVLTEVQKMRREAANSLLKTLEEPPADTILILTADATGDILPTIISRCQEIPFFALNHAKVAEAFMQHADTDELTAATIAAVSGGSLGRARLIAEGDLLEVRHEIITTLIEVRADRPERVERILRLAEKSAALKEQLPELFDLLRMWFRDLILYLSGIPDNMIINRDLLEDFAKAAARWSREELSERIDRFILAEKQLQRNCNRIHVCEMLFFDLL